MRYLSDEWLAQAAAAIDGLNPVESDLSVAIKVTGGPEGERHYRMLLGPDTVGIDRDVEAASVSMTLDWEDAIAVAQGQTSAQRAFLDGRLQLGGDVSSLLGHKQTLTNVDDRLADLRQATTFA